MCVICASAKDKRQPTEKEIRKMFTANPDGAGYMFVRYGMVHIKKGFMTVDSLLNSLKAENFTAKDAVVYHFRISTQAGVKPSMTQPFIISNRIKDTEKLTNCGEIGFAHNGIIRMTSNGDKNYSDTAIFVANCAAMLLRNRKDNHNDYVHKMLTELVGYNNRLAILGGDGHIDLVGSWQKQGGLMFSNLFWASKPKQNTPYSYSGYYTKYPSDKHLMIEDLQSDDWNDRCRKYPASIFESSK